MRAGSDGSKWTLALRDKIEKANEIVCEYVNNYKTLSTYWSTVWSIRVSKNVQATAAESWAREITNEEFQDAPASAELLDIEKHPTRLLEKCPDIPRPADENVHTENKASQELGIHETYPLP